MFAAKWSLVAVQDAIQSLCRLSVIVDTLIMLSVDHGSCFVQRGFPSLLFFRISKVCIVCIPEVILKDYCLNYFISVIVCLILNCKFQCNVSTRNFTCFPSHILQTRIPNLHLRRRMTMNMQQST